MAVRASEGRDVAEHRLAAVAVTGRLHRTHLHDAAHLVHDQRGQGFAVDIFGDDQQRLARLGDRFEQRHQVLGVGDLLLVDQHQAVVELDRLLVFVRDEVGRQVAAVELHPLDHLDGGLVAAAFFDGDHAVLADLAERVGQHVADRGIVVARDRGDLLQALLVS